MQGEYDYYAAHSGLSPKQNYSLADHKAAFFGGDEAGSELAYYHAHTSAQMPDIDSAKLAYFAQQTGMSGDIGFLMTQFFAGNTLTPAMVQLSRVSATIL